jgi:MSHA pilin protein MshB
MKKQQGFTIIELIIVIVIIGLLGANALPRFLGATDDAKDASVEGVAGGFASAVGLVRAEWELAGRPSGDSNVLYDTVSLDVNDLGYPVATANVTTQGDDLTVAHCIQVFNGILQQPPTHIAIGSDYAGERYLVNAGSASTQDCIFALANGTGIESGDTVAAGNFTSTGVQGFYYDADAGQISIFEN